jgi:3-hydroxybutyryl-CoA dehydrogenase
VSIERIGVVGAGTMGHGIAQVCALAGYAVTMTDVSEEAAARGLEQVRGRLGREVEKGRMEAERRDAALARMSTASALESMQGVDLCIEAATESPEVKLDLFARLGRQVGPGAILASNTSSISLTRIAAASGCADRVVGMHFFNPVPMMKLVELIRALQTSEATFAAAREVVERLGKTPVSVQDSPGFVVNRMLVPMINEAVHVLAEGIAGAEEIDAAMKLGANHPIGPLALADLIGIDVCLYVMEVLHRDLGDSKYRPCPLLRRMVDAGRLGRKSGHGFFQYPAG